MRILFINTSDIRGGAAICAYRLRKFSEEKLQDVCCSLVANKKLNDDTVYSTRKGIVAWIEKAIDRSFNMAGLQYQLLPFSALSILSHIKTFRPDVISLHNTHGGYFQTNLLAKISNLAPVVWTLHDMWSFTGNSAHTFSDQSWMQMKNRDHLTHIYPKIGINTGAFLLRQKKKIYDQSNITIVTPSQWMHTMAAQSPVFEKKNIIHINNGIDLKTFRPYEKSQARKLSKLPDDANVIMFTADQLKNNPWKGGNHLAEILKIINNETSKKIRVIIAGANEDDWNFDLSNLVIHKTGYLIDEITMAQYYSASDLLLYPTRADNLPNVLIEAIACGIPCITFNIGGCSEIVKNNINGVVVEPFDCQSIAHAVLSLLEEKEKLKSYSLNARRHAEENYSIEQMGGRYQKLFSSLVN